MTPPLRIPAFPSAKIARIVIKESAVVEGSGSDTGAQAAVRIAEPGGPPAMVEAGRAQEELRMLYAGFGTGMLIAFVFLVYVVLAFAHLFP